MVASTAVQAKQDPLTDIMDIEEVVTLKAESTRQILSGTL